MALIASLGAFDAVGRLGRFVGRATDSSRGLVTGLFLAAPPEEREHDASQQQEKHLQQQCDSSQLPKLTTIRQIVSWQLERYNTSNRQTAPAPEQRTTPQRAPWPPGSLRPGSQRLTCLQVDSASRLKVHQRGPKAGEIRK